MKIRYGVLSEAALATALLLISVGTAAQQASPANVATRPERQARLNTYCNPMDLPYRFRLEAPSRREAADPTIINFKGAYWLFPSKSGGYWHSTDLLHWAFVTPTGLPIEDYAPTVFKIAGKLYWTAGATKALYTTDDPVAGHWTKGAEIGFYGDPDGFVGDDGRVYMYDGLADHGPFHVAELDPKNDFKVLATKDIDTTRDPLHRGFEVPGNNNEILPKLPWLEGAWVTKHAGKYYLQFSGPGTQFKTYADGVLISDYPMGPFAYAPYSPFAFKPTGFITGAGHSSTVEGLDGMYWHVSSMTISVRHIFERRLGLFPTFFEPDGQIVTDTYLGDYPHYVGGDRGPTGWMLLSLNTPTTASSTLDGHEAAKAVDEEIRTWWSAATANAGEWLKTDLGKVKKIEALQIDFADQGSTALGRLENDGYRYVIEASNDDKHWRTVVDRRSVSRDAPNDYEPLAASVMARYVRITNVHMPAGALFSISGLRIFGNGSGPAAAAPIGVKVERETADGRHAVVSWQPSQNAQFYIVRFGIAPDRLFENYQVYAGTTLDVRSLNTGVPYYFTVDAVNDTAVARGAKTVALP